MYEHPGQPPTPGSERRVSPGRAASPPGSASSKRPEGPARSGEGVTRPTSSLVAPRATAPYPGKRGTGRAAGGWGCDYPALRTRNRACDVPAVRRRSSRLSRPWGCCSKSAPALLGEVGKGQHVGYGLGRGRTVRRAGRRRGVLCPHRGGVGLGEDVRTSVATWPDQASVAASTRRSMASDRSTPTTDPQPRRLRRRARGPRRCRRLDPRPVRSGRSRSDQRADGRSASG